MLEPREFATERTTPYATAADFVETFNEEMRSLYLLSFLLTADHDTAEHCLIAAMGESGEGTNAFMDWPSSIRRAVLKQAIAIVMPAPEHADIVSFISLKVPVTSGENKPFDAIPSLDAFERFVFVMSILEGLSDEDCAILLRCSRRDVMIARLLALKRQSHIHGQTEDGDANVN
jgi:hypothetical protein